MGTGTSSYVNVTCSPRKEKHLVSDVSDGDTDLMEIFSVGSGQPCRKHAVCKRHGILLQANRYYNKKMETPVTEDEQGINVGMHGRDSNGSSANHT